MQYRERVPINHINNKKGLFSPNGEYGTQVLENMNERYKGGARRTTKKGPVTKGGSK